VRIQTEGDVSAARVLIGEHVVITSWMPYHEITPGVFIKP